MMKYMRYCKVPKLPNCNIVSPENDCDVCRTKKAKYYNMKYYIHICGATCLEAFETAYNREIDDIAYRKLTPDPKDDTNEV